MPKKFVVLQEGEIFGRIYEAQTLLDAITKLLVLQELSLVGRTCIPPSGNHKAAIAQQLLANAKKHPLITKAAMTRTRRMRVAK